MTTIGYGDIVPGNSSGRVIMIIFISGIVILYTKFVSNMIALFRQFSGSKNYVKRS